ncbi:uncharacterized protein FIBRA_02602 [Fibroporia radiculosa]|uniref:CFEM domain-containing protein n=1 Tax=Fibroporia radiculosa TaxID=599839 RepID=J4G1Z5_9APHY|nr:uncharacterized protein FIBRA_02602 [Fibroporia radiculosa]CCM00568.1 predicted protein [Fibroporia radiculosa]
MMLTRSSPLVFLALAVPLALTTAALPQNGADEYPCIALCETQAAANAGCLSYEDLPCVCTSNAYWSNAQSCMQTSCSSQALQLAQTLQQDQCTYINYVPGGSSAVSSDASVVRSAASSVFSSQSSAISSVVASQSAYYSSVSSALAAAASSLSSSLSVGAASAAGIHQSTTTSTSTSTSAGATKTEAGASGGNSSAGVALRTDGMGALAGVVVAVMGMVLGTRLVL